MTENELRHIEKEPVLMLTYDDRKLLIAEIRKLRRRNLNLTQQCKRFAERIAAQSDLLSQQAEKPTPAP